jgi:LPS sulfotransferase NodH
VIRYEDLDRDPVGVTRAILVFLELELPADANISADNRRLTENLNARWIEQYRAIIADH